MPRLLARSLLTNMPRQVTLRGGVDVVEWIIVARGTRCVTHVVDKNLSICGT